MGTKVYMMLLIDVVFRDALRAPGAASALEVVHKARSSTFMAVRRPKKARISGALIIYGLFI